MAAAVAAVVLVGGYASVKWKIATRKETLAGLNSEQADLTKAVKDGQPTLKNAEAFDEWLRTRAHPLQLMADWNALSPPTDRIFLSNLVYYPPAKAAGARLSGVGFAREREDVIEWFATLSDAGYGVKPDPVDLTRTNPDFPYQFLLEVELPPPPVEPAAVPPQAQVRLE
jgi:hypothetical protein